MNQSEDQSFGAICFGIEKATLLAGRMNTFFSNSLWRISCVLFLVLVGSTHAYQSTHLHHYHQDDSVAFEVSSHSLALATEHSSTKHHHHEDSSHEDDNEHQYKKKVDWNVARSKTLTHLTLDTPLLPLDFYKLPSINFEKYSTFLQVAAPEKETYPFFGIIRGPPQFV